MTSHTSRPLRVFTPVLQRFQLSIQPNHGPRRMVYDMPDCGRQQAIGGRNAIRQSSAQ
jgi:hypothetical protein